MARIIPFPPIVEDITSYVPTPGVENAVLIAGKAMRFKILADRKRAKFRNVDIDGGPEAYEYEGADKLGIWETKDHVQQLKKNGQNRYYFDNAGYTHEPSQPGNPDVVIDRVSGNREDLKDGYDRISLIDIDFHTDQSENKKKYGVLTLPFVPRELSYSTASRFVGIATMGRNNPYYQFTGSEDTLQFNIDWFTNQENREDVISNCRWLESLTKSNSYDSPPHRVILVWGNNNKLYRDQIWLVTNAPYVLSDFNRGYKLNKNDRFVNTNLLPNQAKQEITLKRLTTTNLSTADIAAL